MKRRMSQDFQGSVSEVEEEEQDEEFEYEYDYESGEDVTEVVASHQPLTTRYNSKGIQICSPEVQDMKTYEIDVFTLPQSMQSLVAESESYILRMTFFLDNLSGYVVKGPKFLKPLLEQTLSLKMREHRDAIIDMETLDIFVRTCIVDFHDLYHYCPVCHKAHDSPAASLVPCSQDTCLTQFTEQGLGRDIAVEIRSDPEVVELMITMTYWATLNSDGGRYGSAPAANDKIREANFNPFPLKFVCKTVRQYDMIRESLDKLPSVMVMKDMIDSHTFHNFFADDVYLQEAHYLLTWILNSHRAAIKYVPLAQQTSFEQNLSGGNLHLFKIVNPPEKETAFQRALTAAKNKNKTEFVYHGSRSGCWHSIIRNSLKNLSGTVQMTTGAAYGAGIYLGADVQTSMAYVRAANTVWPQNTLGIQWCMLVAEKVSHTSGPGVHSGHIRVEPDENKVINRYLLCGNVEMQSQVRSVAKA